MRVEDRNLQWFRWQDKLFVELGLVFGTRSRTDIYDIVAKVVLVLNWQQVFVPPTHPGYGRPPADKRSGRQPSVAALKVAVSVFLLCTPV